MTFENISQASEALNFSSHYLATARDAGCLCFRNGRVYGASLVPWLRANQAKMNDWISENYPRLNKRTLDRVEKRLAKIDAEIVDERKVPSPPPPSAP